MNRIIKPSELGKSPVFCCYCGYESLEKRDKAVYSDGKRIITIRPKNQYVWYCWKCNKRMFSLK